MSDWWTEHMSAYRTEGANDAENGIYDPPHQDTDDPQDIEENLAYRQGFEKKRKELGDAFNWFD